jgi:hypothetical protein
MTLKSEVWTLPRLWRSELSTIIGSAAEVHGRAVVSKDETVFFESVENDLIGGGEARNAERRFKTQTHAHWRSVLIGRVGSPVRGGRNKSR